MKTSNLTVRIDPGLKNRAREAARELDISLSQVVSSALRGLIRQAGNHRLYVSEFKGHPYSGSEIERIGEEEGDKASRKVVTDRFEYLLGQEKKNMLNRVTREELKTLKMTMVRM